MTNLEMYNLQNNTKLSTLNFTDEEDWLEIRRKGIGGSDIGAIMGINQYASPLKIYKQKVENYVEDMSHNYNVKKGKDLEDFILNNYVKPELSSQGYVVGKPNFMIINSDTPYIRANVDGIAFRPGENYTDNIIVEIKWVSEHAQCHWDGDDYCGIPPSYYAQVQLYMSTLDCRCAKVCALFDSDWSFHMYTVPRDELFILKLRKAAKDFYEYNMCLKIPPKPNVSLDKADAAKLVKEVKLPTIKSSEMSEIVREYKNVSESIKSLEKQKDELTDQIFKMYTDGYCPDDLTLSVKLSTITARRFNVIKFKEADPATYEQYCDETNTTRFSVK